MGPDKAWGPNRIWGPGIDLRTPWKIFSLRPWLNRWKGHAKARRCNGKPGIVPYEKYASKIGEAQGFKNKLSAKSVQQYIHKNL